MGSAPKLGELPNPGIGTPHAADATGTIDEHEFRTGLPAPIIHRDDIKPALEDDAAVLDSARPGDRDRSDLGQEACSPEAHKQESEATAHRDEICHARHHRRHEDDAAEPEPHHRQPDDETANRHFGELYRA